MSVEDRLQSRESLANANPPLSEKELNRGMRSLCFWDIR